MKQIDANKFASLNELKNEFKELADKGNEALLFVEGRVLMVMDPAKAKEQIATRIAMHFAENPGMMSEIENRLKNETPVDW